MTQNLAKLTITYTQQELTAKNQDEFDKFLQNLKSSFNQGTNSYINAFLENCTTMEQNFKNTIGQMQSIPSTLIILNVIIKLNEKIKDQNLDLKEQFLRGAHIILEDDGILYKMIKERKNFTERISSHHKNNKSQESKDIGVSDQYIFREILIGQTNDKKTWVQVEAHSLNGIIDLLLHLLDYILYKITGKNVSQYGYSEYTEKTPITIKLQSDKVKENTQSSIQRN